MRKVAALAQTLAQLPGLLQNWKLVLCVCVAEGQPLDLAAAVCQTCWLVDQTIVVRAA